MVEDMNSKRIHSFTNDVLGDLDATALAELIKNKSVSAEEVVQAAINRAKAVNPKLVYCFSSGFGQDRRRKYDSFTMDHERRPLPVTLGTGAGASPKRPLNVFLTFQCNKAGHWCG